MTPGPCTHDDDVLLSVEDVVLRRDPGELAGDPGPHLDQGVPMTAVTQQLLPQGVAPLVRLVSQLNLTHLAHVAVHVEVLLHGDHPAHNTVDTW